MTKREAAIKVAKGTLGLGTGLALSTGFVLSMDEMIYADVRKHIVMSMEMNRVRGSSETGDRLSKYV
jgi:hypothetical protein